jgi:hypothetical protein
MNRFQGKLGMSIVNNLFDSLRLVVVGGGKPLRVLAKAMITIISQRRNVPIFSNSVWKPA